MPKDAKSDTASVLTTCVRDLQRLAHAPLYVPADAPRCKSPDCARSAMRMLDEQTKRIEELIDAAAKE